MPGFVSDAVPAYRLRLEDLENYLLRIFPDYTDFKVQLARDEYNISIPRLLSRTEMDEISKLRQPVKRRRGHHQHRH